MRVELTQSQLKYLHFLEKHKIKEERREFISQYAAYQRFGRGNVERWVSMQKVQQYKRPTRIEYRMSQLTSAAETVQDYEF